VADDPDWRHQWWLRRFTPVIALTFGAMYAMSRGRQYEHDDALLMAGAGVVAMGAVSVALYFGLPIFGRVLNEDAGRLDPAPRQTIRGRLASVSLSLICGCAAIVVLWMVIAGGP
jgi:hypothetical protein